MSTKIKSLSKLQIFLLLFLLVGAISGIYLFVHNDNQQDKQVPAQVSSNAGDGINYSPPSPQDKSEAEQNKSKIIQDNKTNSTTSEPTKPTSKIAANPIISSWGQSPDKTTISVSGYISDIYEDGGICTLQLIKSGVSVTQSQTARKDAQVTTCGQIKIDRSKLSPGTWEATIIYSSNSAYGKSDSEKVPVI